MNGNKNKLNSKIIFAKHTLKHTFMYDSWDSPFALLTIET